MSDVPSITVRALDEPGPTRKFVAKPGSPAYFALHDKPVGTCAGIGGFLYERVADE